MADYYVTKQEQDLIKELGFDYSIFEILKREILVEIKHLRDILPERFAERLIAAYPHTIESLNYFDNGITSVPPRGISIQATVIEKPHLFIKYLNKQIKLKGYIAFLTDSTVSPNYDDQVAIIKASDQFEIFKVLPTPFKYIIGNPHYHIKNQQVIEKLKYWHEKFNITLLGVGYNWVEIEFERLPGKYEELIDELKKFSPDTFVCWGDETPEEAMLRVIERLETEQIVYCWWEE